MPKTLYERDMEDSLRQIAVALGVDVSGTPDVEDVIRAAIRVGKDAERYRNALVECAEAFEALDAGGGIDAHEYAASVRRVLVLPNG